MEILFTLVYQPIYNAVIILYNIFGDFGVAIIVLTLIIKLALIPLSRKQIKSQKEMQELQPKIKKLQKKYKGDKERLSKETMKLYKEHKVNPAAGCLPLIIQMIIFIGLYRVINGLSTESFAVLADNLYGFVTLPEVSEGSNYFLGLFDLAKPYIPLAIITAIAQFYQLKMMQIKNKNQEKEKPAEKKDGEKPDFASMMQKQMLIVVPIMTLFIGVRFPSGLALYWFVSTLFMIGQQWILMHKEKNKEHEGEVQQKTK